MVLEGLRSAAWLRAQPSPVIYLYLYTLYHNDFYLRIIQTQPLTLRASSSDTTGVEMLGLCPR